MTTALSCSVRDDARWHGEVSGFRPGGLSVRGTSAHRPACARADDAFPLNELSTRLVAMPQAYGGIRRGPFGAGKRRVSAVLVFRRLVASGVSAELAMLPNVEATAFS